MKANYLTEQDALHLLLFYLRSQWVNKSKCFQLSIH